MSGRGRKPATRELNEQVKRLCGEGPDGMRVWMKLDPECFEPFFQAEEVCLLESPVVSVAAASSWVRQAVDGLLAEAGRTVTHLLLHIGSSGYALSLEMLSEIIKEAQGAIDLAAASFIVGYRAVKGLKEGEATLVVLASVEPEPQPDA